MMDCDTTGIEPDLGLVKVKKLVGGGTMSIVNQTVPRALKALGYTPEQVNDIVAYIDTEKTILGAPHLQKAHEPVFACSMGDNAIHYLGHVKMMGAVQPFLSGAISKTVNMPAEATIEDVEQLHMDAWKLGLKAVAIYRDNSKVAQPLSMAKKEGEKEEAQAAEAAVATAASPAGEATLVDNRIVVKGAVRRLLPRVRNSRTYRFELADLEGYFVVGEYEDGTPGELFINVSKQGSTLSGVMDSFAISISQGLQYGVPLKRFVKSFRGSSYAPSGITDDKDIRTASSITDYIFRRLALDYLSFDDRLELGLASFDDMPEAQTSLLEVSEPASIVVATIADGEPVKAANAPHAENSPSVSEAPAISADDSVVADPAAPLCYNCGNQTQRAGTCYVCSSCGSTTGCS
jgi:ribonucleoside-diphosphate reductase alpha chain